MYYRHVYEGLSIYHPLSALVERHFVESFASPICRSWSVPSVSLAFVGSPATAREGGIDPTGSNRCLQLSIPCMDAVAFHSVPSSAQFALLGS